MGIDKFKYLAFGIINRTKDNFLLPFFDYDIKDIETIKRELHILQNRFKLSTIYLIGSSNGYNAFSLDKLNFMELKNVYNHTKKVDKDFIKWGLHRGFMTLRMGQDKYLCHVLENDNYIYNKSTAHKWFFNEIMNFGIKDKIMFDNETQFTLTSFPSNKHGFDIKRFKKCPLQ